MVPEIIDGGAVSVLEEEPLRPPESWPGAGGLKSVAPEMPSWPTGPIRGLRAPEGSVTEPPKKKGPGESWPGAGTGSGIAQPAAASPTSQNRSARDQVRAEPDRSGHPAMGPSLVLLLAALALAAWVLLDAGSRVPQAIVFVVVLIAGGVFVARTLRGSNRRGG